MNNQIAETNAPQLMTTVPKESAQVTLLRESVQMIEMCGQLGGYYSQTNMVPKAYQGKPGDCAVAIQWGSEIGLSPLQSLQNIAVINGSPALWGDALVALVRGSGVCEYLNVDWDENTKTATAITKRKGEDSEQIRTYSMAEAEQAGLTSRDTYKRYGKRMVSHRARSYVLRDVYADVLKGLRVREVEEDDFNGRKVEKTIPSKPIKSANDLNSMLSDTKKEVKQPPAPQKEPVQEESIKSEAVTPFEEITHYIRDIKNGDDYAVALKMFNKARDNGDCSNDELQTLFNSLNEAFKKHG